MANSSDESLPVPPQSTRKSELLVFGIIVGLLWPVIAVGVVGGYGFIIWMSQLIFGPPGPPGH